MLSTAIGNGGGGPRVVASSAAFHARVRGSVPGLGSLKKNVSSPSTGESQYWTASVTKSWRARPQTARARILNPVSRGSVILIISPSSEGSPGPV